MTSLKGDDDDELTTQSGEKNRVDFLFLFLCVCVFFLCFLLTCAGMW